MEPRSISPIFLRGKDPFPAQRGVLFPAQQPRSVSPLAQQYAASVHYKLLAGLRPRPRPAPPPQQAPSWLPPGASLSKAAAAHRAHRASSAPYQRKPPQQQSSSVSPGRSVSPGTSSGHKPGAGPRSSSLSPPGGHPATLQTPWGLYHSHVLAAASSAATPGLWNPARSSILPAPAAASRSAAAVGGPSRPPFASLTPYATTGALQTPAPQLAGVPACGGGPTASAEGAGTGSGSGAATPPSLGPLEQLVRSALSLSAAGYTEEEHRRHQQLQLQHQQHQQLQPKQLRRQQQQPSPHQLQHPPHLPGDEGESSAAAGTPSPVGALLAALGRHGKPGAATSSQSAATGGRTTASSRARRSAVIVPSAGEFGSPGSLASLDLHAMQPTYPQQQLAQALQPTVLQPHQHSRQHQQEQPQQLPLRPQQAWQPQPPQLQYHHQPLPQQQQQQQQVWGLQRPGQHAAVSALAADGGAKGLQQPYLPSQQALTDLAPASQGPELVLWQSAPLAVPIPPEWIDGLPRPELELDARVRYTAFDAAASAIAARLLDDAQQVARWPERARMALAHLTSPQPPGSGAVAPAAPAAGEPGRWATGVPGGAGAILAAGGCVGADGSQALHAPGDSDALLGAFSPRWSAGAPWAGAGEAAATAGRGVAWGEVQSAAPATAAARPPLRLAASPGLMQLAARAFGGWKHQVALRRLFRYLASGRQTRAMVQVFGAWHDVALAQQVRRLEYDTVQRLECCTVDKCRSPAACCGGASAGTGAGASGSRASAGSTPPSMQRPQLHGLPVSELCQVLESDLEWLTERFLTPSGSGAAGPGSGGWPWDDGAGGGGSLDRRLRSASMGGGVTPPSSRAEAALRTGAQSEGGAGAGVGIAAAWEAMELQGSGRGWGGGASAVRLGLEAVREGSDEETEVMGAAALESSQGEGFRGPGERQLQTALEPRLLGSLWAGAADGEGPIEVTFGDSSTASGGSSRRPSVTGTEVSLADAATLRAGPPGPRAQSAQAPQEQEHQAWPALAAGAQEDDSLPAFGHYEVAVEGLGAAATWSQEPLSRISGGLRAGSGGVGPGFQPAANGVRGDLLEEQQASGGQQRTQQAAHDGQEQYSEGPQQGYEEQGYDGDHDQQHLEPESLEQYEEALEAEAEAEAEAIGEEAAEAPEEEEPPAVYDEESWPPMGRWQASPMKRQDRTPYKRYVALPGPAGVLRLRSEQ
eukprot:XP_001694795.1 predicted protein [Chlamydomonas reinhardtii]